MMLIRLKCGRCCTLLQSLGKIRAFAIQEFVKQPLICTLKLCLTGRIEIKVLITLLFRFSLISSLNIKVENLKPTVGGELIFLPNEDLDLDNNNTRKKHYCTKYFSYIIAILLFFNVSDSSSYLNIRVFHKRTILAILALLPTLYSHKFTVSLFAKCDVSKCEIRCQSTYLEYIFEFFTVCTKLAEMAILYSKDLTTAKKELPPVGST